MRWAGRNPPGRVGGGAGQLGEVLVVSVDEPQLGVDLAQGGADGGEVTSSVMSACYIPRAGGPRGRERRIPSLWHRPYQMIRRGCPIHAAGTTWLGHSRRKIGRTCVGAGPAALADR